MKEKTVLCKEKDCPYCKAGIPRKVIIPVIDLANRTEDTYWNLEMSEEEIKRRYGLFEKIYTEGE